MRPYYMNWETGEITENQREAIEWYRAGIDVEVIGRNGQRARWVH